MSWKIYRVDSFWILNYKEITLGFTCIYFVWCNGLGFGCRTKAFIDIRWIQLLIEIKQEFGPKIIKKK